MQAMTEIIPSVSPEYDFRLNQKKILVLRRDRVGQLNDVGNDQDFGGVYDFFLYRYTQQKINQICLFVPTKW